MCGNGARPRAAGHQRLARAARRPGSSAHRGRMGRTSAEMIEAYVASIELALGRDPRSRDGEHTRRER